MFLITEFKRCRCCRETLPASAFYFNRIRVQLYSECKTCANARAARWVEKNPTRRKEIANGFAKKNYVENRETLLAAAKIRAKNNRPRINARKAERKKSDPTFKLLENLRTRIVKALKGADKSTTTVSLLGCSIAALRIHLENLFKPGMTWENYGPVWHVDHRRPCADFKNLSDPAQQRECFHFSNLQPLFAAENLQKGDRVSNF